jgi:hypothetical protein
MASLDAPASEKQASDTALVSEAVLIAAASALSYAVAYAYRSGFASHFDLPPLLLTPTLGGILQAAATIGLLLLGFWNILNPLWMFLPGKHLALGRIVRRLLLILLIMLLILYGYLTSWWSWALIGTFMSFMAFGFLIFPLITQREIRGYENKLLAQEKVEAARGNTLIDEARRRIGDKALSVIIAAFVLLYFAYAVGKKAAKDQEDYFVLADTPDHVVAAMDDDMVILVAYDPAAMILKRAYTIRRLNSERVWQLEKKHIGKLLEPPPLKGSLPQVQPSVSPTDSASPIQPTTSPTASASATGR